MISGRAPCLFAEDMIASKKDEHTLKFKIFR